jgi:hypothetical protein
MNRRTVRPVLILALSVLVAAGPAGRAVAQTASPAASGPGPKATVLTQGPVQTLVIGDQDAERTRKEFMNLLQRYPPALGRVLKLDPALLSNQGYLAPYPNLVSFLAQHPDVVRNPTYFLEDITSSYGYREPQTTSGERMWERLLDAMGFVIIFGGLVSLFAWLVKSLMDYRRWGRLAKVQAEAHTKLLDRFTANDELIAYVQSPAGSQFLQSAPIALDPGARRLGAPVTRILWSMQAGLVLGMAGLGLRYISGSLTDEGAREPMYVLGVLGMALGVGFLLSALVSYVLAQRLGLFQSPTSRGESGA